MDQKTANELVKTFEKTEGIELFDAEAVQVEETEAYKIIFRNILTEKEYSPVYSKEHFEANIERIKEGFFGPYNLRSAVHHLLNRIKKLEIDQREI